MVLSKKNSGFTLIEIMIALFIFTIVVSIAVASFHTLVRSRERISDNNQKLQQLQIALTLMGRDLQQSVKRPITDGRGNRVKEFTGTEKSVELTRGGSINPLSSEKRSTLLRVAYLFDGDKLIRRTWPVLDRTQLTKHRDKILLGDISEFKVEFLKEENWKKTWDSEIPKAVRITLSLQKFGTIIRTWKILNNVALP